MSINQLIRDVLQWGDVGKIAKILGVSSQAVTDRLKSDKEIDSIDFVNAVCKVTGKDFDYFKAIVLHGNLLQESAMKYKSKSDANGNSAARWKHLYDQLAQELQDKEKLLLQYQAKRTEKIKKLEQRIVDATDIDELRTAASELASLTHSIYEDYNMIKEESAELVDFVEKRFKAKDS